MTLKRFFIPTAKINSKRPQCIQCLHHLHWGSYVNRYKHRGRWSLPAHNVPTCYIGVIFFNTQVIVNSDRHCLCEPCSQIAINSIDIPNRRPLQDSQSMLKSFESLFQRLTQEHEFLQESYDKINPKPSAPQTEDDEKKILLDNEATNEVESNGSMDHDRITNNGNDNDNKNENDNNDNNNSNDNNNNDDNNNNNNNNNMGNASNHQKLDKSTKTHKKRRNTNRKLNYIKYELLTNEDCTDFAKLNKDQIQSLSDACQSSEVDTFLFCTMFYKDWDGETTGNIFGYSRSYCNTLYNRQLDIIYDRFAKLLLNSNYWTRAKIQQNTPKPVSDAIGLGDDNIVLMSDSWTQEIAKPTNFANQKITYFVDKKKGGKNAIKWHDIFCGNGMYVSIVGPFPANGHNNDQFIFNSLSNDDYMAEVQNADHQYNGVPEAASTFKLMRIGDKWILDRG